MISSAEENYLTAMLEGSSDQSPQISTSALSTALKASPAAATDMLKKLHVKGLIHYKPYQGASLSAIGKRHALAALRRQRLWEVFLVQRLKFSWDEVRSVAGQLQHVHSPLLIQRLDGFLGYPAYSPFGAPIPNEEGGITQKQQITLEDMPQGASGIIVAVKDNHAAFLQYLSKRGLYVGAQITVLEKIPFDESLDVSVDNQARLNLSKKVSENLLVAS